MTTPPAPPICDYRIVDKQEEVVSDEMRVVWQKIKRMSRRNYPSVKPKVKK
jgi:hypothetical protein